MEFNSRSQVHKSLPSYWRRRAYRRVGDSETKKKSSPVIRLGDRKKRWRSWKAVVVRPVVKLARLRVPPPAKAMAMLRDGYTDTMVLLSGVLAAKKGGSGACVGTIWDRRIPKGREEGLKLGDFEKKLMLHLYNSIIATR